MDFIAESGIVEVVPMSSSEKSFDAATLRSSRVRFPFLQPPPFYTITDLQPATGDLIGKDMSLDWFAVKTDDRCDFGFLDGSPKFLKNSLANLSEDVFPCITRRYPPDPGIVLSYDIHDLRTFGNIHEHNDVAFQRLTKGCNPGRPPTR